MAVEAVSVGISEGSWRTGAGSGVRIWIDKNDIVPRTRQTVYARGRAGLTVRVTAQAGVEVRIEVRP